MFRRLRARLPRTRIDAAKVRQSVSPDYADDVFTENQVRFKGGIGLGGYLFFRSISKIP